MEFISHPTIFQPDRLPKGSPRQPCDASLVAKPVEAADDTGIFVGPLNTCGWPCSNWWNCTGCGGALRDRHADCNPLGPHLARNRVLRAPAVRQAERIEAGCSRAFPSPPGRRDAAWIIPACALILRDRMSPNWLRHERSRGTPLVVPAARSRARDPVLRGRPTAALARINRRDQLFP